MKRLLAVVVSLVLLTLPGLAGPAHAQDLAWGPAQTLATGRQIIYPAVATSSDGRKAAVVWTRNDIDNQTVRVEVASTTDGGTTWTDARTLASDPQGSYEPQIVSSADGSRLIMVWIARHDVTSNWLLKSRTSSDGGKTWGDLVDVAGSGVTAQKLHLAASPDAQRVVVSWYEEVSKKIYVARSSDAGATWTAPVAIVSDGWFEPQSLLVSDDASRVVQLWGGFSVEFSLATSSDGGATWTSGTSLSKNMVFESDAAMSADGQTMLIAWREYDFQAQKQRVYRSHTTDGGKSWSAPVSVVPQDQPAMFPRVALSPDGQRMAMLWVRGAQSYGGPGSVVFTTSSNGGASWEEGQTLSPDGLLAGEPNLLVSPDGQGVTVTWSAGPADSWRRTLIQARSSADAGQTWGTPSGLATGTGFTNGGLAGSAAGTRIAVWINGDFHTDQSVQAAAAVPPGGAPGSGGQSGSGSGSGQDSGSGSGSGQDSGSGSGSGQDSGSDGQSGSGQDSGADSQSGAGQESSGSDPDATSQPRREPQSPLDARGLPPQRIKVDGVTVVTGRNARTSAGQPILTRVSGQTTAQGDVRYYRVLRGPQGKVSVRTYGHRNLKLVVVHYARGTQTAAPYRQRTVYVGGVPR